MHSCVEGMVSAPAPVTDALGSLLFGGFLKVLGLATAQLLPLWSWSG